MEREWLQVTAEPVDVRGVKPRRVRGGACRTRAALFAEWAEAMDFPESFGDDWDTFAGCLGGLPLPATIVVENAAHLLSAESPEQLGSLLDALAGVARAGSFHVVLSCQEAEVEGLRQRLAEAR